MNRVRSFFRFPFFLPPPRPDWQTQVYSFSGGRIKVANKKFSNLNSEYEITFDQNTQIAAINDDHRISNIT